MEAEVGAEQPSAHVAACVSEMHEPARALEPEHEQTLAYLQERLASRRSSHGGIPVGALLVPKQQANVGRKLLESYNLRLVAVSRTAAGKLLLHLPPEAAAALDQVSDGGCGTIGPRGQLREALRQFVQQSGAVYYPGVRVLDPLLDQKGWPLKPEPLAIPVLPSNSFRFAEVFAGVGGFRAGLQPLGGALSHTHGQARERLVTLFSRACWLRAEQPQFVRR